jgi:prophage regulatory protein
MSISRTPSRLLRRPDVQFRIGLGRSTLYAMIQAGTFPVPVQLGARAVAWHESEIDAWIASRASARPSVLGGAA